MIPPECSEAEVVAAVKSLYGDHLRPYGRLLRKRLVERILAATAKQVDIDLRHLRAACEASCDLEVSEQGSDWSALLRGAASAPCASDAALVDVYSPEDTYPDALWAQATEYFRGLEERDVVLPGGRYSCAQELLSRGLPFLEGRCLGEVCHIVQLAISKRKILGYLNGAVVPHGWSQSLLKESCAKQRCPCEGAVVRGKTVAEWGDVRRCLGEIVRTTVRTNGWMPLSNVKRLFRSRFHLVLSETALGHSKLSEMLRDPRLRDVCSIRLRGNVYAVLPPEQPRAPERVAISLAATLQPGVQPAPAGKKACAKRPGASPELAAGLATGGGAASRTLRFEAEQPAVLSLPSCARSNDAPMLWPNAEPMFDPSAFKVGGDHVKNTFIHAEGSPTSPVRRAVRRNRTLPKDLGSSRDAFQDACRALSFFPGAELGGAGAGSDADARSCSTDSPRSASSGGSPRAGAEAAEACGTHLDGCCATAGARGGPAAAAPTLFQHLHAPRQ